MDRGLIKYIAGVAVLVLAAVVVYIVFRGDPLAKQLNKQWQPISVDQQRQRAIDTAASTLKSMGRPNLAASIDAKTIEALAGPQLKPQGVTAIRVRGDRQLLRLEANFERAFGPDDLPTDSKARDLIATLKPDIAGMIVVSVGVTSALADPQTLKLQLRLLPAVNDIHIDRVTLAGKADVTPVAEALTFVLNRYADNITAALNEVPVLDVSLPSAPLDPIDPSGPIKMSIPNAPGIKVALSGNPIKSPFRVAGIVSLVDGDSLSAIAQVVPIADTTDGPTPTTSTFDAVKDEFLAHLKDGLDISTRPAGIWIAFGKALLADALGSAFGQAKPCITAQGPVPEQSFSKKVALPDETTMDCTPTMSCDQPHDERDCSTCIIPNIFTGGCSQRGNDPVCEAAKAAQNTIYDGNKLACETAKTAKKGACETAKEGLKQISRTGNVANLDGSIGGPAAIRVCVNTADFAKDLSAVSLALSVSGSADLATHIKFVPLDIVGHLACQAPWTEDRTIKATIPEQPLPLKLGLSVKTENGERTYNGRIDEVTLKLHFQPSPTALILQSTNFMLACAPLAGLINTVTVNLAPLIPELLTDFEYKQEAISFSFVPKMPDVKVMGVDVKTDLSETALALVLAGKL
jgi:hypothetical protein